MSGGSNFNHTVITSDGAALIRRSQDERKKIVFIEAVSSEKFENLRGDLAHKQESWFEGAHGSVSAVSAIDGIFQLCVAFSAVQPTAYIKSIGVKAKLNGDSDSQAVIFCAASDDNSQIVIDNSDNNTKFVMDLPANLNASNVDNFGTIPGGGGGGGGDLSNYVTKSELQSELADYTETSDLGDAAFKDVDESISDTDSINLPTSEAVVDYIDSQGFLTQHQSLAGCVASGEYDSNSHNIYLKNSSNSVLSTIDASAFIVDGMIESVEVENGYLVISFNTDAGKEDISIPISDIFDANNYYTKSECDETFATNQDLSDYALASDIPTDVSELNNDAGYITNSDISNMATTDTAQTFTAGKSYEVGALQFPFSTQPLKLALTNNNTEAVFTKGDGSTVTITLSGGGSGNFVTTDTSQTITAAKTFTIPANAQNPIVTIDSTGVHSDLFNGKFIVSNTAYDFGVAGSKGVDTSIGSGATDNNLPTSLAVKSFVEGKGYALASDIPTDVSELNNDAHYITNADLSGYVLASSLGNAAYKGVETSITSSSTNNDVPTSLAVYTYISNQGFALSSEIPTDVSELNNDAGYITNSDLPTVNNASLVIQKNGVDVSTFTANASTNVTANITVPTNVSQLNNDSGFITTSDLPTVNNATLTIQRNGTSVGTFTANSSSDVTANIIVPTNVGDLNNDAGYITTADLSGYVQSSDLGGAAYKGVDTSIGATPTSNLPTSAAVATYISNQGFLTQHQSLAGCVASGEYDSTSHNIYLKNSGGTVLSTIDASAFIKDGMVDTVQIDANNNLVITFNTDSGKQPISISLASIFDPTNYYTKTQIDSGFVTTNTAQNLTGTKTWANSSTVSTTTTTNNLIITGGTTPSEVVEQVAHDLDYDEDTAVKRATVNNGLFKLEDNTYSYDEYYPEIPEGEEEPEAEIYLANSSEYTATINKDQISLSHATEETVYDGDSPFTTVTTNSATLSVGGSSSTNLYMFNYDGAATLQASYNIYGLGFSSDDTNDPYDVTLDSAGLEVSQDGSNYVKLTIDDGLEINASGYIKRQIDKIGLQMGGTRIFWSDVPVSFSAGNGGYYIGTYGSSFERYHVAKKWVTQVHIKDNSGTLSCATQTNGSNGWSAYSPMNASNPKNIADNCVNLIFDANSKLSAVRLTTGSTCGKVLNFKLMIPKNGSYSVVDGIVYASASSTADYTLSTPIELSGGDLLICECEFTPTNFIAVPNA